MHRESCPYYATGMPEVVRVRRMKERDVFIAYQKIYGLLSDLCTTDAHVQRANHLIDECQQSARKRREHRLAEARRAHSILQELFVAQGHLPNNLYMAMTHLHIEIVARTTSPVAAVRKEAACEPGN